MMLVVITITLLLIPNLLAITPPPNGPGCPRCKKVEGEGDLAGNYYFHTENSDCENGCSYEREDGECCFCFAPGNHSVTKCDYETCTAAWLQKNHVDKPEEENRSKKIIGGSDVLHWETWPWTASLQILGAPPAPFKCGGVLISCTHIITALHCLLDQAQRVASPRNVEISLGSTQYMRGIAKFRGRFIVYKAGFVGNIPKDDIAIIEMSRAINPATKIRPILLPTRDVGTIDNPDPKIRSTNFFITGWGGTPDPTDRLKQTNELKLRPGSVCKQVDPTFDETNEICSERFQQNPPKAAFCPGDSGSPGMVKYTSDHEWRVQAVMSYNFGDCTKAGFAGMVNVFYYKSKIDTILQGGVPAGWTIKV